MSVKDAIAQWSDVEQAEAIRLLLQFPLKPEPFLAWCESTITCPMEFCITDKSMWNILLFRRPPSDPIFGGQWHVTGGLMLPGQKPDEVWPRIIAKYGLDATQLSKPIQIGVIDTRKGLQEGGGCPRSQERNIIHIVRYPDTHTPAGGGWFPLSNLPRTAKDKLLGHHQRFIDEILMPYVKSARYRWSKWPR
jgi:hypothetical protein